ncbi:UNVERIFIED_CONTAM: hypothetical protein Slati_3741100 [Sesamum latifolium]|uniref:Uncharacterized protein n=1 Tax=Sesamum latifolium TaxID=2727402 RepID=A0AAW2U3V5_9LAMI
MAEDVRRKREGSQEDEEALGLKISYGVFENGVCVLQYLEMRTKNKKSYIKDKE